MPFAILAIGYGVSLVVEHWDDTPKADLWTSFSLIGGVILIAAGMYICVQAVNGRKRS